MSHHPDEARLLERLARIEALFAGATTPGERDAADSARQRIQARLDELARAAPPVEIRFSLPDAWSRRLFVALLRRYGLSPYRYSGQRRTTVMVKAPERFVKETLLPEFQELSKILQEHLLAVTERVIAQVLGQAATEADELAGPKALGAGGPDEDPGDR